jgi:protein gp37
VTKIEWTDETWNPTRGCSMAVGSELGGCLNCYAARNQLRRPNQTAASGKPFAILRDSGPRWSGEVELVESKLTEPLHWKKPRRVFVNSMSDLFHEELTIEDIVQVFSVMYAAKQHEFQILTKRAARLAKLMPHISQLFGVLPNVWLGVSVEDQANKYRIDLLRQTPAAIRFLSIEPLLEDIGQLDLTGIHWGIVGGESGPQARPCFMDWIESIVDQFQAASVPLFVKQTGRFPNGSGFPDFDYRKRNRKGANMDEWPESIRVREFPR